MDLQKNCVLAEVPKIACTRDRHFFDDLQALQWFHWKLFWFSRRVERINKTTQSKGMTLSNTIGLDVYSMLYYSQIGVSLLTVSTNESIIDCQLTSSCIMQWFVLQTKFIFLHSPLNSRYTSKLDLHSIKALRCYCKFQRREVSIDVWMNVTPSNVATNSIAKGSNG